MRLLQDPNLRTILIIGVTLALTPALVLVVVLGLAILIDNPPLTISELVLFELEALILWIGILVVALFIYYRRKEE
jgi:hypothetical protein